MSTWIKVEDRLPKEGTPVIVVINWDFDQQDPDVSASPGVLSNGDWYGCWFDFAEPIQSISGIVTHWMPLPEPPKEEWPKIGPR